MKKYDERIMITIIRTRTEGITWNKMEKYDERIITIIRTRTEGITWRHLPNQVYQIRCQLELTRPWRKGRAKYAIKWMI